jgi:hypothetical protein
MTEFFVSYTQNDRPWAEWIAYTLEAQGHPCLIQAWDFRPGSNFVLEMQEAAGAAKRTMLVLSPAYLRAAFTAPEWAAAFAADPQGLGRKLVPVRVEACEPQGLLKSIVYIDLVGLDEAAASKALLTGVEPGRAKPQTPPAFPGGATRPTDAPQFPGVAAIRPVETAIATRNAPDSDPRSTGVLHAAPLRERPGWIATVQNQTDAFLRGLYAASTLAAGRKLSAEQVNGLGEVLQMAATETLDVVERLHGDGLAQLHWGGGLSLTTEGRRRAEGGSPKNGPVGSEGVTIGDIGAGANVIIHSPEAVAGYQATGKRATGAGAIRIEAPIGDLAAVIQILRSSRVGLVGALGENAQALQAELEMMLKEAQRPDADQRLEQSIGRSKSLLEGMAQMSETTGKLKPVLELAGVAIAAVAKWLGI